jgi:hypothetical protein
MKPLQDPSNARPFTTAKPANKQASKNLLKNPPQQLPNVHTPFPAPGVPPNNLSPIAAAGAQQPGMNPMEASKKGQGQPYSPKPLSDNLGSGQDQQAVGNKAGSPAFNGDPGGNIEGNKALNQSKGVMQQSLPSTFFPGAPVQQQPMSAPMVKSDTSSLPATSVSSKYIIFKMNKNECPVIKRCFCISIQLSTVKENQAYPDSFSF